MAAAFWDLGERFSFIALMLLVTTFAMGVVMTAIGGTNRRIGVGLILGAVVTAVLLLGWLAVSIQDLNTNGAA